MRRLALGALAVAACAKAVPAPTPAIDGGVGDGRAPDASAPDTRIEVGGNPPPGDASPADPRAPDGAGPPPDASPGPGGGGGGGGSRLVVGCGTGQVISFRFDPASSLVGDPQILDLGAPLLAMERRPHSQLFYAATLEKGAPSATFRVLKPHADGRLAQESQASAGAKDVSSIAFDQSGSWLLYTAGGAFRATQLTADATVGPARQLGACDARSLIADDRNTSLLGLCGYENRLVRFDFSPQAGPSMQRTQVQFTQVHPVGMVAWGDRFLVHGLAENGVAGSENSVALVSLTAREPLGQLKLRPSCLGAMSRPWATAVAKHPILEVAYALNGGSYQYGGQHLAVVGLAPSGALEARQFLDAFAASLALTPSPDGRWLLVGASSVDEVRSWAVDAATGRLTEGKVITLADDPVFIGFL